MSIHNEIKQLIADVLQIGDRAQQLDNNSPLIGALPELDSMAVIGMITAMEEFYGFTVHDDEISAETFATLGTLVAFVQQKLTA